MTGRVGPKGQVVIPKPMRAALGIEAGDDVVFHLEGRCVRIERARTSLEGTFRGHDLTGALEADHRSELVRPAWRP